MRRKQRLKNMMDTLDLNRKVMLTGFLEESRLYALLSTCDCLCLPSVERTEAFGLILLEAMAFAKPVVASDVPGSGIGWVVRDEKTGFLVGPGDPVELARRLEIIGEEPELSIRMGMAGLERLSNGFQIDHIAGDIAELYHLVVNAGKKLFEFERSMYRVRPGGPGNCDVGGRTRYQSTWNIIQVNYKTP